MITNSISPVLLSAGPLQLHWYGLLYVAGIVAVYLLAGRIARQRGLEYGKEWLSELGFSIVLGVIVGARLLYVLSAFSYYAAHPLQVIAIWNGGLAFHGGLIGGVLAGYWHGKRKKMDFLGVADVLVIAVPLALAIGRVGNFINSEFYGPATALPWGVVFPAIDGVARHPTMLYEAAGMLLVCGALWLLKGRGLHKGALLGSFFVLYSLIRFPLEYLKANVTMIGPLTWGQWWSIPMLAAGLWLLVGNRSVRKSHVEK